MPGPLLDRLSYTLEQAAELTGLSRDSIYKAVKSGRLPAKRTSARDDGRPSGKIIILRKNLEAFLESLPDDDWMPY